MKGVFKYILPALAAIVSCTRPAETGRQPIPLVGEVVKGTVGGGAVISAAAAPRSDGEIYIAGSPDFCRTLKDRFLSCDIFENVRGKSWSDGLRDFAGETFSSISDAVHSPYDTVVLSSPDGASSVRELAVRYAIAALDTKYNVSVYDLDGNGTKLPAKVIVLADPWLYEYGKFDVDTLFSQMSCTVPVLSPQDLLFDAALGGGRKCFNIGLICDSTSLGKGIYPSIFRSKTAQHDVVGARFFEGAPGPGEGSLYRFLDAYVEAGNTAPFDAILVDDPYADLQRLQDELKAVRDFSREESMNYGKLVQDGVLLEGSQDLVMRECYSLLRKGSLFTHRIAQPVSKSFSISPRPWVDDMQFLLIGDTDDV